MPDSCPICGADIVFSSDFSTNQYKTYVCTKHINFLFNATIESKSINYHYAFYVLSDPRDEFSTSQVIWLSPKENKKVWLRDDIKVMIFGLGREGLIDPEFSGSGYTAYMFSTEEKVDEFIKNYDMLS